MRKFSIHPLYLLFSKFKLTCSGEGLKSSDRFSWKKHKIRTGKKIRVEQLEREERIGVEQLEREERMQKEKLAMEK